MDSLVCFLARLVRGFRSHGIPLKHGLARGDIGTVLLVHEGCKGCTVEFMTLAGHTIAVVTLLANQIRQISRDEIAHTSVRWQ